MADYYPPKPPVTEDWDETYARKQAVLKQRQSDKGANISNVYIDESMTTKVTFENLLKNAFPPNGFEREKRLKEDADLDERTCVWCGTVCKSKQELEQHESEHTDD